MSSNALRSQKQGQKIQGPDTDEPTPTTGKACEGKKKSMKKQE